MDIKTTVQDEEKIQAALEVDWARPYLADAVRNMYADIAAGKEPEKPDSRFVLHSAIEALDEFEEPEPLLSNQLHYPGALNVLAADGGTGKSYFLLYQAMLIARSGINALYVDEENGDYLMKKRIRALAQGQAIEIPANLFYTTHAGIDLREPAHIEILRAWISGNGVEFVVLDSLNAVTAGADENSSKDMKPPLQALHRLSDELQVCITAIHHTNKNGGYRGSTAIKGEVDSLYLLTSLNGGKELAIKTEKRRDGPPLSVNYSVQFDNDADGKLYSVTYTENEDGIAAGPVFSKSERYVLRFLSERASAAVTEIMGHADTCSDGAARRAIYSLTEKGYLVRTNEGARGAPSVYSLTEKGTRVSCEI